MLAPKHASDISAEIAATMIGAIGAVIGYSSILPPWSMYVLGRPTRSPAPARDKDTKTRNTGV
jgi:hypothetical protein